jgi:hypothetical protein
MLDFQYLKHNLLFSSPQPPFKAGAIGSIILAA